MRCMLEREVTGGRVLGIGHIPTDVSAMDCDFYAAGFHKLDLVGY